MAAPPPGGGDAPARHELLDLWVDQKETVTVVGLRGELDTATAPQLRECLAGCALDGTGDVVVDLGELHFIGAQGLEALVASRDRLCRRGGRLILCSASPFTTKLLGLTGLGDHLASTAGEPV